MLKIQNSYVRRIIHACAFLPFIGWMLPLYLLHDEEHAQMNAKTALGMSALVLTAYAALLFISFFIPAPLVLANNAVSILIYAVLIIYFLFLAVGLVFTQLNRVLVVPYISTKVFALNI